MYLILHTFQWGWKKQIFGWKGPSRLLLLIFIFALFHLGLFTCANPTFANGLFKSSFTSWNEKEICCHGTFTCHHQSHHWVNDNESEHGAHLTIKSFSFSYSQLKVRNRLSISEKNNESLCLTQKKLFPDFFRWARDCRKFDEGENWKKQ